METIMFAMSETVQMALITTLGAVLTVNLPLLIKLWWDMRNMHVMMNSRLDELVTSVRKEEYGRGLAKGKEASREASKEE